jgi:hypothetical protein
MALRNFDALDSPSFISEILKMSYTCFCGQLPQADLQHMSQMGASFFVFLLSGSDGLGILPLPGPLPDRDLELFRVLDAGSTVGNGTTSGNGAAGRFWIFKENIL